MVEPVLSKDHLPKVLADLVPCLNYTCPAVEPPFRSIGETPSELTWPAYVRIIRGWVIDFLRYMTASYLYIDDLSRHCGKSDKVTSSESPWATGSKMQVRPRGG